MTERLISCVWRDGAFHPATPFQRRLADDAFGDGEILLLSVENERSMRSHRHYFASIREAWNNLPESAALETWAQSPEHLRKYALVKVGFADSQTFSCTSAAEAQRWAARLRPIDEFSIVVARGDTVVRFTAKSQSVKAMGAKLFAESKSKVLDFLSDLVGADVRAA